MTQPSSDKLPPVDVCGNHLDRFPCKTCRATVPIECPRFDYDKEAARPLADGDMVERLAEHLSQLYHQIGEQTADACRNQAAEFVEASGLKEEAERERDELRKRLNELARFYPPISETFSSRSDGYASGWRDGVEAMQKKARQP